MRKSAATPFFLLLSITGCTVTQPTVPVQTPTSTSTATSVVTIQSDAKPFIGIGYRPLTELDWLPDGMPDRGLRVIGLLPGSAAAQADVRVGDIIVSYDDRDFRGLDTTAMQQAFINYLDSRQVNDVLTLTLVRLNPQLAVVQNGESLDLQGSEDIPALLAQQSPGDQLHIDLEQRIEVLTRRPVLQARPNLSPEPLPSNADLFPYYETLHMAETPLLQSLLDDPRLQPAWQDLLTRYAKDEYWDDGFRLSLFRYVHRDPLKLIPVSEQITGQLAQHARHQAIPSLVNHAAGLLDEQLDAANTIPYPLTETFAAHIQFIQRVVAEAMRYREQALQSLTTAERADFLKHAPDSDEFFLTFSDTAAAQAQNQRITALPHKVDYHALLLSARILAQLSDAQWLLRLASILSEQPPDPRLSLSGVSGELLYVGDTAAGPLIIGGPGHNRYETTDVAVLIDLGGNDRYLGRSAAADERVPVSVLLDLGGDDDYAATADVSLGSAVLGTALLVDTAGNDVYNGGRITQGSALIGSGMLIDFSGDDQYLGHIYAQASALWGYGLLFDNAGNDRYQADLYAQGMAGPKAVATLLDQQGNDQYHAGSRYRSEYGTNSIFRGASQGFGLGLRGYTSGGIAVLLDGQGADQFQAGNFSQGGGYFFALGILKNGGTDNDRYIGSRYGQGFSAHSAAGVLIDDGGNDSYSGRKGALQAAAWDLGLAVLLDKQGNDVYDSSSLFFSQAAAAHNGFALFIDRQGSDQYHFPAEAKIPSNDYHGGYSLSFQMDLGDGADRYNGDWQPNRQTLMRRDGSAQVDQ